MLLLQKRPPQMEQQNQRNAKREDKRRGKEGSCLMEVKKARIQIDNALQIKTHDCRVSSNRSQNRPERTVGTHELCSLL